MKPQETPKQICYLLMTLCNAFQNIYTTRHVETEVIVDVPKRLLGCHTVGIDLDMIARKGHIIMVLTFHFKLKSQLKTHKICPPSAHPKKPNLT